MNENAMVNWVRQLDRLLRGEATRLSALRQGTIDIAPDGLIMVITVLGLLYGMCMGCYALFQTNGPSPSQFIATTAKVPVLFLLTLVVTFPSLYVFNALVGSRLTLLAVLRLIVAALAIMIAVLAAFGPIVAFFSLSTTSYAFMLLLNVLVFAVSGVLGLKFLLLTLHRLSLVQASEAAPVAEGAAVAPDAAGALDRLDNQVLGRSVKNVFYIWIVVFGLVGAQMSWVLRPFLGHPNNAHFVIFASRQSNFFEAVLHMLGKVVS